MCKANKNRRNKLSKHRVSVDSNMTPEIEIPQCMLQYLEDNQYPSLDNIDSIMHVDGSDN